MTIKEKRKLMGSVVRFSDMLRSSIGYDGKRSITVRKLAKPKAGWVVGFSRRLEGTITYQDGEGTTFEMTNAIPCVLVRTWVNAKEIAVPLSAIEPGDEVDIESPYRWEATWNNARQDVRDQRCPRCGLFRKYSMGRFVEHKECGKEA